MGKKKAVYRGIRYRINDEIFVKSPVRIIGDGIESRVVSISEAKRIASDMGLDLIEINGNTDTPILRIGDYEKMLYKMKKDAKKNAHTSKPIKEIQLSVNIASNDLKTKVNNARKFIEGGSKVKVVLSMRGRELVRREDNKKSILEFIMLLEDVAVPESMPKDDGNKTIVILKKKA